MLLHQILVTGLFERTKGPDNDLPQVQGRISLRSTPPSFPVLPPGTIQRRGEIVQNKLQPLKIYATWAPARIHPALPQRSESQFGRPGQSDLTRGGPKPEPPRYCCSR